MRKLVYVFLLLIIASGCGKEVTVKAPAPEKALLTFPEKDGLCIAGTIINDTQSKLTFKWGAAKNADSYDLVVKNLLTGALVTYTTNTPQYTAQLSRKTPYSWFVNSRSASNTTITGSDTWKFYNAGPGVTSYAPYPAEIVSPLFGKNVATGTGQITLNWNGADVDNDIASYDVYFDSKPTPALFKAGLTDTKCDVSIRGTITYYWKVITHDKAGNTSDSGTFQFTVN